MNTAESVLRDRQQRLTSLGCRVLSDPTRRKLLRLLRGGEKTMGELAEQLAISAPSLSYHFNLLRQSDLIRSHRRASQIFHSLDTDAVECLLDSIGSVFGYFFNYGEDNPSKSDKPGEEPR